MTRMDTSIEYDTDQATTRAAVLTFSQDTYLYPLLETTFEGVPCKIPYGYKEMLASEYDEKALKNTHFHG